MQKMISDSNEFLLANKCFFDISKTIKANNKCEQVEEQEKVRTRKNEKI